MYIYMISPLCDRNVRDIPLHLFYPHVPPPPAHPLYNIIRDEHIASMMSCIMHQLQETSRHLWTLTGKPQKKSILLELYSPLCLNNHLEHFINTNSIFDLIVILTPPPPPLFERVTLGKYILLALFCHCNTVRQPITQSKPNIYIVCMWYKWKGDSLWFIRGIIKNNNILSKPEKHNIKGRTLLF